MFILLSGEVHIIRDDTVIASLKAGDLIGEMSFLSKQPASASAVAKGVVQYAYWKHEDLALINKKSCDVYNKLISIIGNDLVRKLNRQNKTNL